MTASWEVTGVLARGGGPVRRAQPEPTFLFRRAAGEENFGWRGPKQPFLPKENAWDNFRKVGRARNHSPENEVARTRRSWLLVGLSSAGFCWCCCLGGRHPRASSSAAVLVARPTARQLLECPRAMLSPCDHEALAVLTRRVLRVSAAFRRGAAAYADGCEQFPGPSHLISH